MKYYISAFVLILVISCNSSKSGSGNIITEKRKVENFENISVSQSIIVDIKTGAAYSVEVEADDNIEPFVLTSVSNNTLNIKLDQINNLRNATVRVHVQAPSYKNFNTSSSAEINASEEIKQTDLFTLKASSGSNINLKLNAPNINGSVSSGSEITLTGKCKDLKLAANSGGAINAENLKAEMAVAKVSSGSQINVFASILLRAEASSGGSINYTGGAKVEQNVSSGGSVSSQ